MVLRVLFYDPLRSLSVHLSIYMSLKISIKFSIHSDTVRTHRCRIGLVFHENLVYQQWRFSWIGKKWSALAQGPVEEFQDPIQSRNPGPPPVLARHTLSISFEGSFGQLSFSTYK